MAGLFSFHNREAVRVKVKKVGLTPREVSDGCVAKARYLPIEEKLDRKQDEDSENKSLDPAQPTRRQDRQQSTDVAGDNNKRDVISYFDKWLDEKCEGLLQPEYRKFSVDPQITSFEVLQSLLARAFDIRGEFTISYLARDDCGQETYFSLLSDWDLDAAFLGASSPCLRLKVDLKPFEEGLEDWDIIAPADFSVNSQSKDRSTFAGTILNQMEKTLNIFQRALSFVDNQTLGQQMVKPPKAPMTDSEFHNYLDSDGRLVRPDELRLSIYRGGLEPGLRKVVWKHILNVYPEGLSGAERVDYVKRLSKEYYGLRDTWLKAAESSVALEEMQTITNMVRKDVLRTDRTHRFYAGSDDNKNVVSLFNVLTTYALNHPSVSYCQGMSDLASPLLVTMNDEAHAYVCFCALMKRLQANFMLDGRAMTVKFQHLTEALQNYDPTFYEYLQRQGADDLLFCYRWLLLELKREFAFDDALRMLEVLWSSLPHDPPEAELELYEVRFDPKRTATPSSSSGSSTSQSPKPKHRSAENPYTKVRAMRRQSSGSSCSSSRSLAAPSRGESKVAVKTSVEGRYAHRHLLSKQLSFQDNDVPNEILPDYLPLSTPISRELRIDLEGLNRQLPGRGEHLFGRIVDADELESPSGGCEAARLSNGQASAAEDEDVLESSTSDSEASSGEKIRRVASAAKRTRKDDDADVKEDASVTTSNNWSETVARTSDDSDCDDDNSLHLNGEILENDYDDDDDDVVFDASAPEVLGRYKNPHLKSVIPIRLVRDRSQQQMSPPSTRDPARGSIDANYDEGDVLRCKCRRNVSEGYATSDEACSVSPETSILRSTRDGRCDCRSLAPDDDDDSSSSRGFTDSGLMADVATSSPMTNSCEEALETVQYSLLSCPSSVGAGHQAAPPLPPPTELGGGNPFMVFLCLTLLLQHRDYVMKNRMDYNEMAMHFDKMVRRHNVARVLHQARTLFADYMKERSWEDAGPESSIEFSDQHV